MEEIFDYYEDDDPSTLNWIEVCSRCGSSNINVNDDPNDEDNLQIWAVCLDCNYESSETTWRLASE